MMNKKPLNVLLADDDADDRLLFEQALKEIPIDTHLTTVKDGEELMDYLSDITKAQDFASLLPNVLFLDLSMPRKNGFECLVEIKHDVKLENIPLVIFSISFPQDSTFDRGMKKIFSEIGAHDFIQKTHDFEQLKQAIHNALIMAIEKL